MEDKDIEKSFEEIIARYSGLITKICYYFSSDSEDFKDLRQEVFFNIWKGIDKFKNDSKLSTWIYRVGFNTCISFHRKEKNIEKISLGKIMELPDENLESSKLEKYKTMLALIRQLNYQDRVLILLWLDEMSYDEIASITGLNRNTVAIKLKRIKEKLTKMAK